MATLVLDSGNGLGPAISLRSWLREGWAILFSHPLDFVRCELEMDRWLQVVQKAFVDQRVRPLALALPSAAVGSQTRDEEWVGKITSDHRTVCLEPARDPSDLQARALREHLASRDQRFVSIIDPDMRRHKTFSYSDFASLPSPLDFVAWIRAFHARKEVRASAPAEEERFRFEHLIATRWRRPRGYAAHAHVS